jgi:RND family efflux transporter MFP subunit
MQHTGRILALVLTVVAALAVGCEADNEDDRSSQVQTFAVERGDLAVEVSASGNLGFSREEELAFDMAGTVEEVLVQEGDEVSDGQLLATVDTSEWEDKLPSLRMSVLQAEISLENAEKALDEAEEETRVSIVGDVVVKEAPDDRQIKIREMELELAKQKLEAAKADLEEALQIDPEVSAPFDGFVTHVHVEGGDEVYKGTVAVTLVDPDAFEAGILVNEDDISQVTEGTEAWVEVDSLGVSLPATVTDIAPTATIQSGVVNYEVTVELLSAEEMRARMQEAVRDFEARQSPNSTQPEPATGDTPERQGLPPLGDTGEGRGAGRNTSAENDFFESIQLRQGLSVTVTLVVAERSDVLLVPNAAISMRAGQTFVSVLADDGTEEEREIVTGLSNWQYTEAVEGLDEGEKVIIPEGATAEATSQESRGGMSGGMFSIPGMRPR